MIAVGAFIVKIASEDGQSAVRPAANAAPLAAAPAAAQPIVDTASKTSAGESFLAAINVQPAQTPLQPVDMPVFYETGWQTYDDYTWTGSPDNVVGYSSSSGSTAYYASAEGGILGSPSSSSSSAAAAAAAETNSGVSGGSEGSSGISGGSAGGASSSSGDSSSSDTSQTSGDSSADTSSGGTTHTSGSGGAVNPFSNIAVTVVSSMERLLQDDISAPGENYAEIFCAKNETESFQILITNQSYSKLLDVELHVSDWQGPSGAQKPKLTLFREHYVKTTVPSYSLSPDTPIGWYPDALIPFVDPYTGKAITTGLYQANHQSVAPRKSQGYWVDVRVDSDVPAGTYTASILVTSSSRPVAEIPVTLTVWNFALPKQRDWTAWFSMITNLGKVYGLVDNKGDDFELLLQRYQDMLYEHGVYPTMQMPLYPIVDTKTGAVNFDGYNRFLPNFKAFVKRYGPGVYRILDHFPNEFDKYGNNPKLSKTLSDFHHFQTKYPELGQFFYIIDEPYSDEGGRKVIAVGRIIDRVAPSIKLLVNGAWFIYYKDPSVTEAAVEAAIDIRSIYSLNYLSTPEQLAAVENFISDGKVVWVCQGTRLDRPILHHRIGAWRGYCLGASGQLEWRSSVSDPAMDPWVNPVTYTDDSGKQYNGNGMFIYQGTPNRVGLSGPGGPIASMRLKVFRDAVDDYAYFKLAEASAGRPAVVSLVDPAAPDFKTSKSPAVYASVRKAVAALILENQ